MSGGDDTDGLAAERTAFAWTRSIVLVAAAAGSVAKAAISDGRPLLGVLTACALLALVGLLAARHGVRARRGDAGPQARRRDRAALTGVVLVTAAAAAAISATLVP